MSSRNPKAASSNHDRSEVKENTREPRMPRPTEKEAQRREQIEDAEQLKVAKLKKAAERRIVHDSDSDVEPGEEKPELNITTRVVPTKLTMTKEKVLSQRAGKIPEVSTRMFKEVTNDQEAVTIIQMIALKRPVSRKTEWTATQIGICTQISVTAIHAIAPKRPISLETERTATRIGTCTLIFVKMMRSIATGNTGAGELTRARGLLLTLSAAGRRQRVIRGVVLRL
ncbi:hypothetical protein MVEN_00019500 [Mycena venus]|uniref:Uncharacterized protein n=1 Tax=Mycena venus TaxID=2733690 RepID=A0A8H6Z2Y0_9AGAR|nr:hypothetical protein MVEN_00019500 [Mycena venus]